MKIYLDKQKHINDLRRSAGLPPISADFKYEYIRNNDAYNNWALSKMDDLGYPLRVEPKRDRIILNRQGLKKTMAELITKELLTFEKEIMSFVDNDVTKVIEGQAYDLLDQIFSLGDPSYRPKVKPVDDKSHWAYKLGSAIAEAVLNGLDDILTEGMY